MEAAPDLRAPPNGTVIPCDEIMDALRALDGAVPTEQVTRLMSRADRLRDLYRGNQLLA